MSAHAQQRTDDGGIQVANVGGHVILIGGFASWLSGLIAGAAVVFVLGLVMAPRPPSQPCTVTAQQRLVVPVEVSSCPVVRAQ